MYARRAPLLLVALALLTACGSTRDPRLDAAGRAEEEGRWEAAADRYLAMLDAEPEPEGVRAKAGPALARAIEARLAAADDAVARGAWDDARADYDAIESLLARGDAVGVQPDARPDLATRREAIRVGILRESLDAADALAAAGDVDGALEAYRAVRARENVPEELVARAVEGELDVLLGAARERTGAGAFDEAAALATRALRIEGLTTGQRARAADVRAEVRAARYESLMADARAARAAGRPVDAYGIARTAIALYGDDADEASGARAFAREVEEEGTLRVVVVPFGVTDRLTGLVPAAVHEGADAALAATPWADPPPFVEIADPEQVRTRLVMLVFDDPVLSDRRAVKLGEALEADYVAVPFLSGYRAGAAGEPERRRLANPEGGELDVEVHPACRVAAEGGWKLIAVAGGATVAEGEFRAEARRDHPHVRETSVFVDPERWELTDEQAGWFDLDARVEVERALAETVAEALAARFAPSLFREVTALVK